MNTRGMLAHKKLKKIKKIKLLYENHVEGLHWCTLGAPRLKVDALERINEHPRHARTKLAF